MDSAAWAVLGNCPWPDSADDRSRQKIADIQRSATKVRNGVRTSPPTEIALARHFETFGLAIGMGAFRPVPVVWVPARYEPVLSEGSHLRKPPLQALSDEQWTAIREIVEGEPPTHVRIAAGIGVYQTTISRRAAKEGCGGRSTSAGRACAPHIAR
jgi:hypothetical protein